MTDKKSLEEVAQKLDPAAKVVSLPNRKPPLVSWTIKLKFPGSDEPDFIRVEDSADPAEFERRMTAFRKHLLDAGYEEVSRAARAKKPAPPAQAPASSQPAKQVTPVSAPTREDADGSDIVFQAELSRRPDKRLELAVWGYLGDGTEMQYPLLRYIAPPEMMHEMLLPVGWDVHITNDDPLPIREQVAWLVHWRQGRPTGKGGHYKDLLALEVEP